MNTINRIQQLSPQKIVQQQIAEKESKISFSELLKHQLNEVNSLQQEANKVIENFNSGDVKNVHDVMIAMEKADISFNLMVEIRNKLVQSYQEIMRMQV